MGLSLLKRTKQRQMEKIEVPCNWELQGFGEYTYGRWYTIKGAKPSDETGIYRHKFEAPKSWSGQRVKIYFDGVMTDTEVLINGKLAGEMHQADSTVFVMTSPTYSPSERKIHLK